MKHIVVLGFGRSGTTWISDIISKSTGGLILFEPLHPSVTEFSKQFSYSHVSQDNSQGLEDYLCKVMAKQHRKMWLMRNHVPVRLEDISQQFLEMIWENCRVIGFKEIRANFMIQWLRHQFQAQIVFIVRHPCAVISSILRRRNFWEFGWPETYEMFLAKTIYNENYRHHKITECIDLVRNASTDIEKFTIMWAITHAIVIPELEMLGIPLFYYEDFYTNPFPAVKSLLSYLGLANVNIHPAYIFTPSMTTLRTLHGLYDSEKLIKNGASMFWENALSSQQVSSIMNIIAHFDIELYHEKTYSQQGHFHVLNNCSAHDGYCQESRGS